MADFSIGIIGYGRFARLLEQIIIEKLPEAELKIYDRKNMDLSGVFSTIEDVCRCSFIIPAVPISQIEAVAEQIKSLVSRGSVIIDVASVKEYPIKVYTKTLENKAQIIATHPMFGPGNFKGEKINNQLEGLNIVVDNVSTSTEIYAKFLNLLKNLKLNIIEMSPSDHDRIAAHSQFTTLVIAFTLKSFNFSRSKIDTKSATVLKNVVEMITVDKSLLVDMYRYNKYCKLELDKLSNKFEEVKKYFK